MVIKIHRGETLAGPLAYNYKKEGAEAAEILVRNRMRGDNSLADAMRHFKSYTEHTSGRRIASPVFTVSINPAQEDLETLTDEQMGEIARTYMERMGYGDQPYIVFKHTDIERTHLHIVSVGVDAKGNPIDTHNEKYRSSRIRREIEKEFSLARAEDRKRQKGRAETEDFQERVSDAIERATRTGQAELRRAIRSALRHAEKYKYTDLRTYNDILRDYGVEAMKVTSDSGREGLVFFAIDKDGRRRTAPIKASDLSREFALPRFIEKTENNAKTDGENRKIKGEARERIKNVIDRALRKGVTEEEFTLLLKASGVRTVISRTKEGETFGFKFIDDISGEILKGSEVGKEYTAAAIKPRLREKGEGRKPSREEAKKIYAIAMQTLRNAEKATGKTRCNILINAERMREQMMEETLKAFPEVGVKDVMAIVSSLIRARIEEGERMLQDETAELKRDCDRAFAYMGGGGDTATLEYLRRKGILYDSIKEELYMANNPEARIKASRYDINPIAESTKDAGSLSKEDREILKQIEEGGITAETFKRYEPWREALKIMKEDDRKKCLRAMTLSETRRTTKSATSARDAVEKLLEKGFVIKPILRDGKIEGYAVGECHAPQNEYVRVGEELKQKLDEAMYYNTMLRTAMDTVYTKSGKVRADYSMSVRLIRAMEIRDEKRKADAIEKVLQGITDARLRQRVKERVDTGCTIKDVVETLREGMRQSQTRQRWGRGL